MGCAVLVEHCPFARRQAGTRSRYPGQSTIIFKFFLVVQGRPGPSRVVQGHPGPSGPFDSVWREIYGVSMKDLAKFCSICNAEIFGVLYKKTGKYSYFYKCNNCGDIKEKQIKRRIVERPTGWVNPEEMRQKEIAKEKERKREIYYDYSNGSLRNRGYAIHKCFTCKKLCNFNHKCSSKSVARETSIYIVCG